MLASKLARAVGGVLVGDDVEVCGVTYDSRHVRPGDAFVAIRGGRADGAAFAAAAVAAGAVVVIGVGQGDGGASRIVVDDARAALADAAAALHGHPARELTVVGVTGTDGKTTTSWLVAHLLASAGIRAGLLSTVGYRLPGGELRPHDAHLTTPEAPQVHQTLRRMVEAGATHVVLEASSHALALDRVRGIGYDVGVWTQLTREHLDFHHSMEDYFATKRRLVERSRVAVLNADDPWTEGLRGVAPAEVTYSAAGAGADWSAQNLVEHANGLAFVLHTPAGPYGVNLPMAGSFNVANALAAAAAVTRLGVTPEQVVGGLASFAGVPGRMQLVGNDRGVRVVVDFAHTPASITNVLTALRRSTPGRVFIVVGAAGGLRDVGRIAPMGEAAARLADLAIFTEDDSYDTDPAFLLGELARGAAAPHLVVPDRREAIATALDRARPGDTVLLAGKGAETTLERGTGPVPWSDADVAAELLGR